MTAKRVLLLVVLLAVAPSLEAQGNNQQGKQSKQSARKQPGKQKKRPN